MNAMKTIKTAPVNQTLERVSHCLYRSKKSKIYYAILKRAGKQIKRSLKTTDSALAKRRLSELQDKAARLTTGESGRISFADLSQRWLEVLAGSMKHSSHFRLSGVAKKLNEFLESSKELRDHVTSAMIYPAVLFFVGGSGAPPREPF